MEKQHFRKTLLAYLKSRVKMLAFLCLFFVIFGAILALYNLPVYAVGYAALLSSCAILAAAVFDFFHFKNKHSQLLRLQQDITLGQAPLPACENLLEQDYQTLLQLLQQQYAQTVSTADSEKSEMMDYYTLWAHQIKSPIAAMNLLLQTQDNEQNQELSQQLFQIQQYVEMVLQYLRLGSSSSDFVIRMYSLDDIVRQAVHKYAKLFVRKKIALDFVPLQVQVLTDEKWLVFVVEQLLSNALKYTRQGKVSIYMQPLKKNLVIEDTGIGIAAEDLPRVFEKGFTGYNGRTDKKSTGIGLYLCKKVLGKLSHTISITSQPGSGTKVIIGLDSIQLQHE